MEHSTFEISNRLAKLREAFRTVAQMWAIRFPWVFQENPIKEDELKHLSPLELRALKGRIEPFTIR
jgi:hypothetical protein